MTADPNRVKGKIHSGFIAAQNNILWESATGRESTEAHQKTSNPLLPSVGSLLHTEGMYWQIKGKILWSFVTG